MLRENPGKAGEGGEGGGGCWPYEKFGGGKRKNNVVWDGGADLKGFYWPSENLVGAGAGRGIGRPQSRPLF